MLRERAQRTPRDQWVIGFLYDDSKTPRPLDRADLDQATSEHPVMVRHRGGHSIFVNSVALQVAGVTEATPDPENGKFFRDSAGRLNGRVAEAAMERFEKLTAYTPKRQDYQNATKQTSAMFASRGITSACDAYGGPNELRGYQDARDSGSCVRVCMCMPHTTRWTG